MEKAKRDAITMALKTACEVIEESPEIITPEIQHLAYKAFQMISLQSAIESPSEIVDLGISPEYLGEVMAKAISDPDIARISDIPDMNYWKSVAAYLGPDWVQANYHVAVFMTKVV
jgi:hypothetical protein